MPTPTLLPHQAPRPRPNPQTKSHDQILNKSKKFELETNFEFEKTARSEQEQDQGAQLSHHHHHLHQLVDQRVQELKNTTSENPQPHEFSPSKKIKLEKLKTGTGGGEGGVKTLIEKWGGVEKVNLGN